MAEEGDENFPNFDLMSAFGVERPERENQNQNSRSFSPGLGCSKAD